MQDFQAAFSNSYLWNNTSASGQADTCRWFVRKVEWNETSAVVPSSVWPEVIHSVLSVTEWLPAFSWTGHFECTCCARGTGLVLSRTALWYCFGDKLWPSFQRNYNCQWKKGSLPQNNPIMLVDTIPTQNAHPLVWLITLRSTIKGAISNLKKKDWCQSRTARSDDCLTDL